MLTPSPQMIPDLDTLVVLFYGAPAELARFSAVESDELPSAYRRLLDHEEQMTVAVEAYYNAAVDVRVLKRAVAGSHYARMILLARQTDDRIVQFGIMRVNFAYLDAGVQKEIRSESIPL